MDFFFFVKSIENTANIYQDKTFKNIVDGPGQWLYKKIGIDKILKLTLLFVYNITFPYL